MKKFLLALSALTLALSTCSCSEKSSVNTSSSASTADESSESSSEKTTVTLGAVEIDPDISKLINDFNNSADKYFIDIRSYNDPEKTITDMNRELKIDIVSGKSPDIIICSDTAVYDLLASQGTFADLSDIYADSDILPNIRTICTDDNGSVYRVPIGFTAMTAFTEAENGIDCTEIFSYKTMKNVMDNLKSGEYLTGNMMSAEYSTRYALINDFSDTKSHSCNFDSAEFIEALDFYKQLRLQRHDINTDGKAIVLYATLANAPSVNSIINNTFKGKNMLVTPPEYARIQLEKSFAISKTASDAKKEAAKEFIRFAVSDKCVNTKTPIYFPITESGLDLALGVEFENVEGETKVTQTLSEETQAFYKNYLKGITKENHIDRNILYIFSEETEAFFNGEASAEKCADMIQNRASLYLSEQE